MFKRACLLFCNSNIDNHSQHVYSDLLAAVYLLEGSNYSGPVAAISAAAQAAWAGAGAAHMELEGDVAPAADCDAAAAQPAPAAGPRARRPMSSPMTSRLPNTSSGSTAASGGRRPAIGRVSWP